jgi:hypothetical protein
LSFGHNRFTEGLRASRCIKIETFLLEIEVNRIIKPFGILRCMPGFAGEAIDISSEHGVGVIKRK